MEKSKGYILPSYDEKTLRLLDQITEARKQRCSYFQRDLFGEPAWDILLVLYAHALSQRKIAVTELSEAAGLPQTTTLRWLHALEADELVGRSSDPLDARRALISLSEQGLAAMDGVLAMIEHVLAEHQA